MNREYGEAELSSVQRWRSRVVDSDCAAAASTHGRYRLDTIIGRQCASDRASAEYYCSPALHQCRAPVTRHLPPPTSTPIQREHSPLVSLRCGLRPASHSTQNTSFWRRFPKPVSWLGTEETKPNQTQQKHAFTNQKKCTTTQK